MTVTVLISVTGHMVRSYNSNYLFLLPFYTPFASWKHLAGHGSLLGGVTQTFISERSGSLVMPGLAYLIL